MYLPLDKLGKSVTPATGGPAAEDIAERAAAAVAGDRMQAESNGLRPREAR